MKIKTATKNTFVCCYRIKENEGCNIIKSMNKRVNKLLPNNTKTEVMFKSTKLSSCFNVKDKIDFEHNHDSIYHTKCSEPTCIDNYVGESAC